MTSENAKRSNFKDKVLPGLEFLLQLSLCLTKNRRDAIGLIREAMAEAYWYWDESISDAACKMWLHTIMTRRYFDGFMQRARPHVPNSGNNVDENPGENARPCPTTTINNREDFFLTGESQDESGLIEAFAGLPMKFRTAMILSYLEGFSNRQIAYLAGAQPHAIESMLKRGRELLREELFTYLISHKSFDKIADREAASG